MELKKFQTDLSEKFRAFDRESGPFFLMTVLLSEIGELTTAVKQDKIESISEELADGIFTLISIANLYDIDVSSALREKYVGKNAQEISKKWAEPYLGNRKAGL
jgi:NTP pyrophosphatase (non-canonical NTP hydrolase)